MSGTDPLDAAFAAFWQDHGELWGRPAPDFPLAFVFPHGGPVPRHPSQLYEAALEGGTARRA